MIFRSMEINIFDKMSTTVVESPIPIAFIADVGLTGELKKVPSIEIRVKELARMGFKKVYVAKDSFSKEVKIPNIKIMSMKELLRSSLQVKEII